MKIPKDFVLTPGGYRHKSLVHELEHGHSLRRNTKGDIEIVEMQTGSVKVLPKIKEGDVNGLNSFAPDGDNWVAAALYTNSGGIISSFSGTTELQQPSEDAGQTFFLYFCQQSYSNPNANSLAWNFMTVLHWGPSAIAQSGPFWYLATWIIFPDGHAVHSTPVVLQQADYVRFGGVIRLQLPTYTYLNNAHLYTANGKPVFNPNFVTSLTQTIGNTMDLLSICMEYYQPAGDFSYRNFPNSLITPGYLPFDYTIGYGSTELPSSQWIPRVVKSNQVVTGIEITPNPPNQIVSLYSLTGSVSFALQQIPA